MGMESLACGCYAYCDTCLRFGLVGMVITLDIEVIEKWFNLHSTLTKANFEMLKEMHMLIYESVKEPVLNPVKRVETVNVSPPPKFIPNDVSSVLLDKGERLGVVSGVAVHKNVVDAVKNTLFANPESDLTNVLGLYYDLDVLSPLSVKKYIWSYKKYLSLNDESFKDLIKERTDLKKLDVGDRGRVVAQYGHTKIYENILRDFKQAKSDGYSTKRIIRRWYPHLKRSTVHNYEGTYRKHLNIEKCEAKVNPVVKRPPTDAYAFNEVYDTYVLKREVDNVLRAMRMVRYKYRPTAGNIADEMDMAKARVRATLNTLIKQNLVGVNKEGDTNTYYRKQKL